MHYILDKSIEKPYKQSRFELIGQLTTNHINYDYLDHLEAN